MLSIDRLKILYTGMLPPHPGGSAISGLQLLVGLARLGHVVHALSPITSDKLSSGDALAKKYPEINLTRFLIPYFHIDPNVPEPDKYRNLEHEQIQNKLPSLIENEEPDIVLIGRGAFVLDVPDIASTYSIPCVLRSAGARTHGILNGYFSEALTQELLKQYNKVDLIITPAKHMTESLLRIGFNNVKTILNAIDLYQFTPKLKNEILLKELAIRKDEIIIVHPSNLKTLKRPLDIINAAEEAIKQYPNLVYIVIGDGPLRETMEKACKQKRIWEKFRYLGWVEYDSMPDYINIADIVVMPSEGEGLSRVYLETQACSRLLLASDIPSAREVIVDGETGLLFKKGDIDDLTAKTLLAARDPELRTEIGRKARERVNAHSISDAVSKYQVTLEEIIDQQR